MAYRASQVCSVVGIKPTTLRQWHLRGVFVCEADLLLGLDPDSLIDAESKLGRPISPEEIGEFRRIASGAWRRYTFRDVVRLGVIQHLVRLGVSIEHAGKFARWVDGEGSLTWPKPARSNQEGSGLIERPERFDEFLVFFEPERTEAELPDDLPEEFLQHLQNQATRQVNGVEQLPRVFERHLFGDGPHAPYYDRAVAIVVNVSRIAREAKKRLASRGQA